MPKQYHWSLGSSSFDISFLLVHLPVLIMLAKNEEVSLEGTLIVSDSAFCSFYGD